MNASRAKRLNKGVAWALAGALLLPAAALAQDGPLDLTSPLKLEPPKNTGVEPARPRPARSAMPPMPSTLPTEGAGSAVTGGAVQAESLGSINPDVAGTLGPDNGGFANTLWADTSKTVVETQLAQLPVTSASPAMRDLMRRLLLTAATVPDGIPSGSLIALRAGQLNAMGDFAGVNALLSAVPGRADFPDLLRVEVDSRFLTGDVARACRLTHAFIQERRTTYWQKAFIFCQALEGDTASATLGISLLEELGVQDSVFFNLIDALARMNDPNFKVPVIESMADPTPLHLALARVAKAQLPSDVIASNRPGVLRAIAISPNASGELRLEAAERAEVAGALAVDALRQLYASIEFNEEQLKSPLTHAGQMSGPMSRALLYRATLMQTVPAAQAEALQQVLNVARDSGRYASTARAFLPQLARVPVSDDLAWFAPEAIRAFLISGRFEGARPWFSLLEDEADGDPKMLAELESLMPVARLSGFEGADDWTMERLPGWWDSIKSKEGARDKAATLAGVFAALGEYVPGEFWSQLIDGTTHTAMMAPYPSHWFLLEDAAFNNRVGEVVLLSLVSLGEGGPARSEPVVLQHVLKALRRIGLEHDARAMALEAVVAAGL